MRILREVEEYIRRNSGVVTDLDHFYCIEALDEAYQAYKRGDYAIGAVAILIHEGMGYEFHQGNAMRSGLGIVDHAETRALIDLAGFAINTLGVRDISAEERSRYAQVQPWRTYEEDCNRPDGIYLYSTLEACPLCSCATINAGGLFPTGVVKSVSAALDLQGGISCNHKFDSFPDVWKVIRQTRGVDFSIFEGDERLSELCLRIFEETRETVDAKLSGK